MISYDGSDWFVSVEDGFSINFFVALAVDCQRVFVGHKHQIDHQRLVIVSIQSH